MRGFLSDLIHVKLNRSCDLVNFNAQFLRNFILGFEAKNREELIQKYSTVMMRFRSAHQKSIEHIVVV